MRVQRGIGSLIFYLMLILLVIMTLLPFAIMISGSFKTDVEMNRYPLSLLIRDPKLENYQTLFNTIPFFRQFLNSLWVATTCACVAMVCNGLVAYGFTRFEFAGKSTLFTLMLSTMLVPGMVFMVPQFRMYQQLGMFGTYFPLIIPFTMGAFGVFLIRQVMSQVPLELFESATIDGCGELRIFFTIALPLSAAGIGIQGVLSFMGAWNDFMTPLIYLNKDVMLTLPIGLMRVQDFYKITYGAPLAGAFLSCVPVIIILTVVGQRYFMQGLMAGAVKG